MKTTTRRTVIVVTAGALGLAAFAVAAPALAGTPFGWPTIAVSEQGPGWQWSGGPGMGGGMGSGMNGGMGSRMGGPAGVGPMADGACLFGVTEPKGVLTDQQQQTLAAMANDEKLAQDLYVAFAAKYDAVIFDHIAVAETRHLTLVRTLLERYGLTDPTAGKPAGQFGDAAVQATYERLRTQGLANQAAALAVGVQVEQRSIAGLTTALDGLTALDAKQVYTHLRLASQHHMAAFQRWATR